MSAYQIRPPLPPQITHPEVPFVLDLSNRGEMSDEVKLACIAAALQSVLPSGDLHVDSSGRIITTTANDSTSRTQNSLWYSAGLIAGLDRSPR